jgi:hypothetical protein
LRSRLWHIVSVLAVLAVAVDDITVVPPISASETFSRSMEVKVRGSANEWLVLLSIRFEFLSIEMVNDSSWPSVAAGAGTHGRKGGRGGRETPCPGGRGGAGGCSAVPAAVGGLGGRGGGAMAAGVPDNLPSQLRSRSRRGAAAQGAGTAPLRSAVARRGGSDQRSHVGSGRARAAAQGVGAAPVSDRAHRAGAAGLRLRGGAGAAPGARRPQGRFRWRRGPWSTEAWRLELGAAWDSGRERRRPDTKRRTRVLGFLTFWAQDINLMEMAKWASPSRLRPVLWTRTSAAARAAVS